MVWRISAAEARAYWEVATAATLEGCARELESLDAAPQASKAAGEEPQPVAVVRDHPEDYGTLIDALVALPVGTQLYAAPQASADLVRNSALGTRYGPSSTPTAASICSKSREPSTPSSCKGRQPPSSWPRPHRHARRLPRPAQSGARRARAEPGLAEMLRQLQDHLQELGERWYDGDMAVVDELQLTASNRKRAKRWRKGRPTWLKTANRMDTTRGRAARRSDPVAITATLKRAMRASPAPGRELGAGRTRAPAPQTGASRSPGMPHMPSSRPNTGGASECFAPAWPTCSTTPWIQPGARIFSASSRPPRTWTGCCSRSASATSGTCRTVRLR